MIGFCVVMRGGSVDVRDGPTNDADCTITSDYAEALAIARDPEAASADPSAMAERIADGRLTIKAIPRLRLPFCERSISISCSPNSQRDQFLSAGAEQAVCTPCSTRACFRKTIG